MLLIVKRVDPNNIGDYVCNPADYFNLGPTRTQDIYDKIDFSGVDAVIVGGGGMFHFEPQMRELMRTNLPLICWGAGTNKHDSTELDYGGIDLDRFRLLGLRDAGPHHLPCVSCMNPLLVPRKGFGVRSYLHKDHRFDLGFPVLSNKERDLAKVIDFLNGAEVIVTNTYHGWYWSVLLGKKVILYRPFSSKFFHLPFKVPIAYAADDVIRIARGDIQTYPLALAEARQMNVDFASKVMSL